MSQSTQTPLAPPEITGIYPLLHRPPDEETAAFDKLRRTYHALEADPGNDFHRVAFLKARLSWKRLTSTGGSRRRPPPIAPQGRRT